MRVWGRQGRLEAAALVNRRPQDLRGGHRVAVPPVERVLPRVPLARRENCVSRGKLGKAGPAAGTPPRPVGVRAVGDAPTRNGRLGGPAARRVHTVGGKTQAGRAWELPGTRGWATGQSEIRESRAEWGAGATRGKHGWTGAAPHPRWISAGGVRRTQRADGWASRATSGGTRTGDMSGPGKWTLGIRRVMLGRGISQHRPVALVLRVPRGALPARRWAPTVSIRGGPNT